MNNNNDKNHFEHFMKVCSETLNKHAPHKKKYL